MYKYIYIYVPIFQLVSAQLSPFLPSRRGDADLLEALLGHVERSFLTLGAHGALLPPRTRCTTKGIAWDTRPGYG